MRARGVVDWASSRAESLARTVFDQGPRLVDTTMLYAPKSGGVKRYLTAKRAWFAKARPHIRHTLVVPGPRHAYDGNGRLSIYAAPLPFGDGYRVPLGRNAWMKRLMRQRPTLIEAGDPYTPGLAAQKAGEALGVPVIGFCHTDVGALAALHFGEWAEKPIRRHWGEIYRRFDRAVAPSRFIAERLADAGVEDPIALPLGVDTESFRPDGADPAGLRRRLGLTAKDRLLVFAGRPAREKRVDVIVEAVEKLGDPYKLLLVGARATTPSPGRVLELPYETEPAKLAALMASCDAFAHANDSEPFGLIVLEAMACGLPVVGVAAGGVGESVDRQVGELATTSTAADFAAAIEALFERDLGRLGRAARARACERHGWDAVFRRLAALYADVSGEAAFARAAADFALAS